MDNSIIQQFGFGNEADDSRAWDEVRSAPYEALDFFSHWLQEDCQIGEIERRESLYKMLIKYLATNGDGGIAFQVTETQKRIGFLLKYKSYGIKAAIPLGYSLFFLEQNEGFSFQNHLTFKTEIFRFLSIEQGGFLYLCTADEWERVYHKQEFSEWLNGKADQKYDQYRYTPNPGDVARVWQTGIVHTVIGAACEEFANVSTDMVSRLHDQNVGRAIPKKFNRAFFLDRLNQIHDPESSQLVVRDDETFKTQDLESNNIGSVTTMLLSDAIEYQAKRVTIDQKGSWEFSTNSQFMCAYIAFGGLRCTLISHRGILLNQVLELNKNDVFFSLPHCVWRFENAAVKETRLSILQVDEEKALS